MGLFRQYRLLVIGLLLVVTFALYSLLSVHVLTQHLENGAIKRSNAIKSQPQNEHEEKIQRYIDRFKIDWNCELNSTITPWKLAESFMTSRQITQEDKRLGCILRALQRKRVTHADVGVKGTQLKLSLTLAGEQRAVFKPKVYERDYIMVGTPYAGKDRHNAEIAAFHINRIIGLNTAPIVVGRVVNLDRDIRPIAHHNLLHTFYYEKASTCFYGKCHYCKGPETGVCADGSLMEGSITLWLPDSFPTGSIVPHPWRRTYNEHKKPKWETEKNYCQTVKDTRPYESPPRLLDLIDLAIFDFIISNADRHHYETLEYSKDSMVVGLDNGKSFGNPYHDELSILTPLTQCCMIRRSTYGRLIDLKDGVLGSVFENVLQSEPLHPVLSPMHFSAVDRRLVTVLEAIEHCKNTSHSAVLLDDGYG